ncbi:MAG: ABC transporter ATP-binding protein [Chloroflexi bacterium]|nr:ABC transporter ATP-binding protein [Chloroflexota bacterium]
MPDLLAVENLRQIFGGRNRTYAVDDVSFRIPAEPRIVSLVGESGSGKSTIARIILGLLRPTAGTVLYDGVDIFRPDRSWNRRFRSEVQAVFQDPYSVYNPVYKAERVLKLVIRKFGLAKTKAEARERMEAALRAVDLQPDEVLDRHPHQLSGGQRQRLMLARVYLMRPRLIVADEPVSMIDAGMRASFLNILGDFRDNHGISTLFITHDLSTAMYLGGEIIVLYQGRIMETGATHSVMSAPMHPYAQLLIDSIPTPDPRRRWEEDLSSAPLSEIGGATVASAPNRDHCLFADRCPQVMEKCWAARPVLRAPAARAADAAHRDVACYLYD